ncbi:MAG: hypothetical protein WAL63_12240 [Solirubrobacteraceae bacterium]
MASSTVRTMGTSGSGESEPAGPGHHGTGIYIAFVPWVLFGVISRADTLEAAAIVALVAAIAIAVPGFRAGRPKVLELGAIVAFAGFTVVTLVADPSVTTWLERYARAIAASLLALIAFGSLALTPFTEQYARESVPRKFWSSPRFKQVNRDLSLMWALVFLAMVPSHIAAGIIDTRRGNTIFNWVIPIALVVYAAKRTGRATASEDNPPRATTTARERRR